MSNLPSIAMIHGWNMISSEKVTRNKILLFSFKVKSMVYIGCYSVGDLKNMAKKGGNLECTC